MSHGVLIEIYVAAEKHNDPGGIIAFSVYDRPRLIASCLAELRDEPARRFKSPGREPRRPWQACNLLRKIGILIDYHRRRPSLDTRPLCLGFMH
jgi:hypothetical protein